MAVAKSATSSGVITGTASSAQHTAAALLTVGASDTFLLVGVEADTTTPGTVSANWDTAGTNQAMTLLGTVVTDTDGTKKMTLALFGLVNPTPGSNTFGHTWSGQAAAVNAYIFAISFTGSETTSVAAATEGYATNHASSGTTLTVMTAVSIPTGDMAVAFYALARSFSSGFPPVSDGGTAIGKNESLTTNAAAEYYSGSGSAVAASTAQASTGAWVAAIVGIKVPASAADTLFAQAVM